MWSGGSDCSIQWLMLRRHRLIHDGRAIAALGALGPKSLPKRLSRITEADVGMAAGDELAERCHMDRLDRAQPVVVRMGIADEVRGQPVEQRSACGLHLLVHGDLKSVAA